MTLSTIMLIIGGAIGCVVGVAHGVLLRRYLTRPLLAHIASQPQLSRPIKRMIGPLMQFSTFAWITGGLALIAVALCSDFPTKLAVSLIVGSQYLFGGAFNLATTRGAHPGWIFMALAVGCITLGLLVDPTR